MTEFDHYTIPIANRKLNYMYDNYGVWPNTEWGVCVLVAAASLKKQGLDYQNPTLTLDHAFDTWFKSIDDDKYQDAFDHIEREYLQKSDEHYFVKQYLFRLPDIYYKDFINAIVTYQRVFEIQTGQNAYYATELLIGISEEVINEFVDRNYTDMLGRLTR